jgi:hypothetical protein
MRIGVFGQQWWTPACAALGHEAVPLPMPLEPPADKHHADAAARLAAGERSVERLRDQRVDFLLDDADAHAGTPLALSPYRRPVQLG